MSPSELFDAVVRRAPGFGPARAEHMSDNGELLPHVLMSDLLQFVGAHVGTPEVGDVLALLEAEVAGGDSDTENVIAVSFLENLEAEAFYERLYALLGPRLRAAHAPFAWNRSAEADVG